MAENLLDRGNESCHDQRHGQAEHSASERRGEDPSHEELHARYLEQQRRMLCPGCGEGHEFF